MKNTGIVRKLFIRRESPLIVVVLALVAGLTLSSPYFFTSGNLTILARQISLALIIAIGMTFVILTSGIDLSVGSVVALTSVLIGKFIVTAKMSIILGVVLALLAALVIGAINGAITAYVGLPAFVTTLGMLAMARGLALGITGGSTISGFKDSFLVYGQGSFLHLPVPFWFAFVITIVSIFILNKTVFGRQIYFIGSNETAASLSGIPVKRVKIATYMISSFLAAVSGILETSRLSVGQPSAGNGYELVAIGASVIGGVSLFGGAGSVLGTIFGTTLLLLIQNGLILLSVSPYWQQVFSGAIIIIAVTLNLKSGKRKTS
jgi:ribose/xylose/arabinose/galactoside ABC-type transport system permease subunit